ncbi:hypothetical protein BDF20DRAFT_633514 [Mycotypha africana]|uniref:uncharacterized protein n=1 Tax=Mycotypha africana TaxID=64632 RepID=UPI00230177F2|nr:uncharacterized protein BDF20DRAFT_633514 [Mycotypha africana]KAI8973208.1 hypothetical protein BDF20DRAFT_633514 [Mycotypha africana]
MSSFIQSTVTDVSDSSFMQQVEFRDQSMLTDASLSSIPPHLVNMFSTMNTNDVSVVVPDTSFSSNNVLPFGPDAATQQYSLITSSNQEHPSTTTSFAPIAPNVDYEQNEQLQMQMALQQHQEQLWEQYPLMRQVSEYHQQIHQSLQMQKMRLLQQQQQQVQQYSYPALSTSMLYQTAAESLHQMTFQQLNEYEQQARITEEISAHTTVKQFSPVYAQSLPSLVASPTNTSSSVFVNNPKENSVFMLKKRIELV